MELTGNLVQLHADNRQLFRSKNQALQLRAIEIFVRGDPDILLVGGQGGVYRPYAPEVYDEAGPPPLWTLYGQGLPNTVVTDLVYDPVDDLLVAATWGRGIWTVPDASESFTEALFLEAD